MTKEKNVYLKKKIIKSGEDGILLLPRSYPCAETLTSNTSGLTVSI